VQFNYSHVSHTAATFKKELKRFPEEVKRNSEKNISKTILGFIIRKFLMDNPTLRNRLGSKLLVLNAQSTDQENGRHLLFGNNA
jgi:hypothetical protein